MFKRRNTVTSVDVTGRLHTNSGPALFASAVAGLGIAQASSAMCAKEIQAGVLVTLLRDFTLEPIEVHAVFPAGTRPSTKVRAFADFLATALSGVQTADEDAGRRIAQDV